MQLRQRLFQHVDMLAGIIGERSPDFPEALEATRTYIERQLREMGLSPDVEVYPCSRRAVNLEVVLGADLPRNALVVGAHYDTNPHTPGADDNASAVAILLETVRMLTADVSRLRRPIRCVFYDCEEMPYFASDSMGSQHHARTLRANGVRLAGMICLESLGYFPRGVDPRVMRPWYVRWLDALFGGDHIIAVANFMSAMVLAKFALRAWLGRLPKFVPALLPGKHGNHALSDNRAYWQHDYPALMLTNTAFLRNPNYHKPTDTPDTLDYDKMVRITQALRRIVVGW